ncbi:MAG: hypothetical protein WCK60_00835 [Candidatus Nomurabacteria bacterium]
MKVQNILTEKKSILIEVLVLCIFLGAMYYVYTIMSEKPPTTTASTKKLLLGPNLTLLMKAVNEEHLILNDTSFMNGEVVRQLQDFSEIILPNPTHGRDDPFFPYR